MTNLRDLREQIDRLDYQIHDLLSERAHLALAVGKYKHDTLGETALFYHPEREKQILAQIEAYNQGPLSTPAIHRIFQSIMRECLSLQEDTYSTMPLVSPIQAPHSPIGIVGYGRFGRVLADLLKPHTPVWIIDPALETLPTDPHLGKASLPDISTLKTVFIAVPIRAFEATLQQIAPFLTGQHTVIDVCSVKVLPVQWMEKHLPTNVDLIATHPLFGPDSLDKLPLKIVMHSVRDQYGGFLLWKQFFQQLAWQVLEFSPDKHDQRMAETQALTHWIGRTLSQLKATASLLDTASYQKLLEIAQQIEKDSVTLFQDLCEFNPYTRSNFDNFLTRAQHLAHDQK